MIKILLLVLISAFVCAEFYFLLNFKTPNYSCHSACQLQGRYISHMWLLLFV
jgi:hypothetical protein